MSYETTLISDTEGNLLLDVWRGTDDTYALMTFKQAQRFFLDPYLEPTMYAHREKPFTKKELKGTLTFKRAK